MKPSTQLLANVVLDLDGTIVFPDRAEIAIPGRSRPTFMATSTAALLAKIASRSNLYVASARNAVSVEGLARAVPQVQFAGFVLECGLVWRSNIYAVPDLTANSSSRDSLRDLLLCHLSGWECVTGYEQMICCVAPLHIEYPLKHVAKVLQHLDFPSQWQLHQERRKIFLYPAKLCKVTGLSKLGVSRIEFAAGDDARYDYSLLATCSYPLTLPSADENLINLVHSRRGFVATEMCHAGAAQVLEQIDRMLESD